MACVRVLILSQVYALRPLFIGFQHLTLALEIWLRLQHYWQQLFVLPPLGDLLRVLTLDVP